MATTITKYWPFDAGNGADITESQWRDMARHWLETGVIKGEDNTFAVSEKGSGADMSVDVATGKCWIIGHYGESDSVVNLAINDGDGSNDRIDRVVLRLDAANNLIELDILEGTPAATPAAPALTEGASTWEISLAQILVSTGESTSIVDADITDERVLVSRTASRALFADGSTVTINNSTTETDFINETITADTLQTGDVLRVVLWGDYTENDNTANTRDLNIYVDGTSQISRTLAWAPDLEAGARQWRMEATMAVEAQTTSQRLEAVLVTSGTATGQWEDVGNQFIGTATPNKDFSASIVIRVSMTHGTASANSETVKRGYTIERIAA